LDRPGEEGGKTDRRQNKIKREWIKPLEVPDILRRNETEKA
tara:strand:- start:678 stop:800 length:123 start_codon:yes stop_codon:yes gene_type:complete